MEGISDELTMQVFPLLAVPGNGLVPPAANHGVRFLVSRDGLMREVTTPWLKAIVPAAIGQLSPTPYGAVDPEIELLCGPIPMDLIGQFLVMARAAMPDETTAAIVWRPDTQAWRLAPRLVTKASSERVQYGEAQLQDGEVMVVDIHSHGSTRPFFSAEDDIDDRGGLKIAAVVGQVDSDAPKLRARLVCLDRYIDLAIDSGGGVHYGELQ